ncbi:hypothetical protein BDV41DRAFT_561942 [Aspergillus transmontanensis]|uniref:Uncharacterized protein n=1 Tax=Aspergillus transmontanensis TaxID=1034304 RepID=A0A5N6W9Z8_9EURO|nr:hypothetical protein BDV41DRAFT_561942 [Aspergillus transmontanensis]
MVVGPSFWVDIWARYVNAAYGQDAFNFTTAEDIINSKLDKTENKVHRHQGVYQGSVKQPDHFLRVDADPDARIVMESGWSESFPHLQSDKDLWMKGNAKMKGTAEIWRRDPTGNLVLTTMTIFPAPTPLPHNELIQITKGDLFGLALLPGQAAGTVIDLGIVKLWSFASEVSGTMGMQPLHKTQS